MTEIGAPPTVRSEAHAQFSAVDTVDGFRERTPWLNSVDLHADYQLPIGGERRVLLLADVFNVFNQREPIDYDNYTESTFTVLNPDFGRVIEYQDPIQARIGLRFEF